MDKEYFIILNGEKDGEICKQSKAVVMAKNAIEAVKVARNDCSKNNKELKWNISDIKKI